MPPASPTSSNAGTPSHWLAGLGIDLPLLIATPVLLIPLFTIAANHLSDETIVVIVTLLGANAHHLPGFLRAYGDPAFRTRYKVRLTIAPIAIIGVCLAFFHLQLNGLLFVAFVWGIWHALAQVYGIGRMYDGRASLISATTARLDKAICIGWFFGGFLFSSHRLSLAFTELYRAGVPTIPAFALEWLRAGWVVGTLLVTIAWALNQYRLAKAGQGNPVKVVLFASSFLFWWYSNIPIESAIVGVVLFEAFHDVQYLTTVWLYNQRIVQKGQRLGAFSNVLFRPGLIGIAIYVGLCFVYGSSSVAVNSLLGDTATTTIAALVLSSLLLHFYYDSFLWNVRDPAVRADFDLAKQTGTAAPIETGGGFRLPAGSAWAWFVVPLALLLLVQANRPQDTNQELVASAKLAETLPDYEGALLRYGQALFDAGRPRQALDVIERSAAAHPESIDTLRSQVEAYARNGRLREALASLERLDDLGGVDARTLVGLGVLSHERSPAAAEDFFVRALAIDPANLEARMNLASILLSQNKLSDARTQLIEARRLAPDRPRIDFNLGIVEAARGDYAAAAAAFRAVLRVEPNNQRAAKELARVEAAGREAAGR